MQARDRAHVANKENVHNNIIRLCGKNRACACVQTKYKQCNMIVMHVVGEMKKKEEKTNTCIKKYKRMQVHTILLAKFY